MTLPDIDNAYHKIIGSLDNKEFKNAFDTLHILIANSGEYIFQDKLDELQETYKNMLRYRTDGAVDPMQNTIYKNLQKATYSLAEQIKLNLFTQESSLVYYSNKRIVNNREKVSYKELHGRLVVDHETSNHAAFEDGLNSLFMKIWVSDSLKSDEANEIRQLLSDISLPYTVGCQIVSALALGVQEYFDKEKIILLFDAASNTENEIRTRAYISILLSLFYHRKRINLYSPISNRLAIIAEDRSFEKLIRTITLRFILARETEKITRKLQTEIIPKMIKLNPNISRKIDLSDINPDQANDEMNPEWKKTFDEGLSKELEEFSQLQQEGADVMHSTFIHLKNFPFFSKIGNWFLPFNSKHSTLNKDSEDKPNSALDMLQTAPFMCNSDKYSLYFSIMQLPTEHREMVIGQLNGQMDDALKQNKEELMANIDNTETIIGQYIQDLYRFYKLYSARRDFDDMFTFALDFHNISIIKPYLENEESLTIIAEYYLCKGYYDDALSLYTHINKTYRQSPEVLQKIGYCKQMNGEIEDALEDYLCAELSSPNSKWLLRRIANCYRTLKQPKEALEFYIRYDKLQPDSLPIMTNIGNCLLEMKDYQEALKYFYKVDYLDSNSHKMWRPIAWCSFLVGKYDHARNYYSKILKEKPSAQDYLNAGHTEWALQNLKTALEYYKQAVIADSNNYSQFLNQFSQDKPDLIKAGIEEEEIPLMLDQLQYSL